MKLLLLPLLVCIYSFAFGQGIGWQEIGSTDCGAVLIKLGEKPDSTISGAYEIKINGTPDAACVVVVRSYFMNTAGNKLSADLTINNASNWQNRGKIDADSLIGFMHSDIISSTGCSCTGGAGSTGTVNSGQVAAAPPLAADPRAESIQAEKSGLQKSETRKVKSDNQRAVAPDTAVADAWGAATPDSVFKTNSSSVTTTEMAAVSTLPEQAAPAKAVAAALPAASPDTALADNQGTAAATKNTPADTSAQRGGWAAVHELPVEAADAEVATTGRDAANPKSNLIRNWGALIANWGVAADSSILDDSILDVNLADPYANEPLFKVLSPEELDSIRIYHDPYILEGLYTISNALVVMDADRTTRTIVATAREELDLLEEKQALFMEKYAKLVKTGKYGLSVCSACNGNPILYKSDSYPPYESCSECKGGGYQLTYRGNAKPNTIEHLYFAELLPTPDYRKPTTKRVSENPADFYYENGIFKTNAEELSAKKLPFFFICMYYKGDASKPNRMVISEIINKKEQDQFAGAGKDYIRLLLQPFLREKTKMPDEIAIWEFNSFEDAYNRSIVPLHRAGVVGFEVEVIKYE